MTYYMVFLLKNNFWLRQMKGKMLDVLVHIELFGNIYLDLKSFNMQMIIKGVHIAYIFVCDHYSYRFN